jgi:hypothetical protein
VFTNLAHGVGFDAPGSAYMFTLRRAAANFAASVNLNTCNTLPSSRTHQFLFRASTASLVPGLLR